MTWPARPGAARLVSTATGSLSICHSVKIQSKPHFVRMVSLSQSMDLVACSGNDLLVAAGHNCVIHRTPARPDLVGATTTRQRNWSSLL